MRLFAIFLFFCICSSRANDNLNGWISGSTLWGQGNGGISLKLKDKEIVLVDNFVLKNKKIEYSEIELSLSVKNNAFGIRNRWDTEYMENAPFVGHRNRFKLILPCSLYNDIEYRDLKELDYFRSSHSLTIVYPYGIFGEKEVKPFVANSVYFNVNSLDMEKNRLYLGYFIDISKYKFTFYYIPKVWGTIGQEWDDQMKFGGSVTLMF